MNERRYLIEVLLRARESISPIAKKVADSLKDVGKAQDNVSDSSRRATTTAQQQRGALEQLVAAHTREKKALEESAAVYRYRANAVKESADASRRELEQLQKQARIESAVATERQRRDIEEVTRIRLEVAEREALGQVQDKEFKAETSRLRKEAALLEALANESAASNRRQAAELGVQIANRQQDTRELSRSAQAANTVARAEETARDRSSRSLGRAEEQLRRMETTTSRSETSTTRFRGALQRLGIQSDGTSSSLRGLNSEFQGFQLAIIIKYAQSLLSTLIALGAQLVAVAAAAGQAAAGLGAAFGAAAAQAVPVVGVLAAAFGRLTAVLKAVKLQNQQQLTDTHNTETAARRQTAAADSIRNAQQQVADAHRGVARAVQDLARAQADASRQETRAQQDVTRARKDAIRTVQDLIAAEQQSVQSVESAQQGLRSAIQSGDVAGTAQAQLDLSQARTGLRRARQDAAPVRARGVEGVDAVQQSEQRLADVRRTNAQQLAAAAQQVSDAQRQARRSEQDLARTRVEATQNINQETAAADKLTNSIKLLSPAEQQLYRRILALQAVYKRAVTPITDIITNAFTGVVDRVNQLLRDPRLMRGFRDIAVEIAGSIRQATSEAGGPRSVGIFETLQREATRNIPIVTRIAINFFRTLRSLIVDALPSFRVLLGYIDGYASGLRNAVETHPGQLRDFFIQGVRYANQFFQLGLAVIRLLLAIGGRGGAAGEGARTIQELTGYVDHLTDRVNQNTGSIRRFFASTHDSVKEVLGVLGTLAVVLFDAFNPQSIKTLADFLNTVIIPAIGTTIKVMGLLVNTFHQFLTLPGVTQLAELAATALLMAKGIDIIHHAVSGVIQIIPAFLRGFGLMKVAEEGAAAELGFFEAMTPGGWILIAIGAVAAAIVLLDRHFHFLGPTFRWLKGAASDAFDWIKTAARNVVNWFSDVWNRGLLKWVREPFIALGRIFGHSTLFNAILRDARALLGFFAGPAWAALKALIVVPFEAARIALDVVWGVIQSIVVIALDVLSGRFRRLGPQLSAIWGGIWDGIKGALVDALNALIGILNSAIDDINKISPFGDIGRIGKVSDDTQDKVTGATDKMSDQYDKVGDHASDNAGRVKSSMEDISKATDGASKASAKSFDQLFQATKVSLRDIRQVVRINSENIAATLGKNSQAGKEALADNFRQAAGAVKKQMDNGEVSTRNGMRAIRGYLSDELQVYGLSLRQARTLAAARARGDITTSFTGGPEEGTRGPGHAGGGMVSGHGGWPRDDHMVVDPYGNISAMVSGNEGIVNPPQMERINRWGSIVKGLGLDSYGSLQEMWGMRGGGQLRFAGGGKLQLPATFRSTHQTAGLPGYPAVDVFASPGTSVGSPINGQVTKISGRPPSAGAYMGPGGPFGWSEYISGGGRTYFLTHFGSTAVSLGEKVRRGQIIGTVGDYPGSVPDHIHEGLHGAGMAVVRGGAATAATAPTPRRIRAPYVAGGRAVGAAVQQALRVSAAAANRLLQRSASRSGNFPSGDSRTGGAQVVPLSGSLQSLNRVFPMHHTGTPGAMLSPGTVRRIAASVGFPAVAGEQIAHGESNYMPGIVEWPPEADGAQGYGLMQMTTGHVDRPVEALIRRLGGWRQMLNPIKNFMAAKKLYDIGGLGRWHGTRYLTRAGGGMLQRGSSPRRFQGGGLLRPVTRATAPAFTQINTVLGGVANALEPFARAGSRARGLALRIQHAFTILTADNGLLDQLSTAIESIATRGAVALQRLQFRITRGGAQRRYLAPEEVAQANLNITQATGRGLQQEGATLQGDLATAQEQLAVATARRNKKAIANARASITNLRTRIDKNATAIAQNAQDQVEAQETFQQALLDSVNTAADQMNNAIDRWSRTAKALGRTIDPNVVLGAQIGNMQRQIGGLRGVLARAVRTGNIDLATTVRGQIEELNTQIAEAVAQQFQNSIDAVNNAAATSNARLDRASRRAQIGGQVDYAAMQTILNQRQGVMATQRAGLAGLLGYAYATGNTDQIINLTDQIDELDTTMAENTQAIRDNTDAAFNARTQQINDTAGFAQTLFSGAQGFFQALTERTGVDTTGQQATSLTGLATSLATQQGGLKGQLAALLGYSPQEAQQLANLTGADLVSYLTSIASGPALDAILSRLDPTQQAAFKDLISGLIANATATEQNTKALQDLTGSNAQSFTSSFWSAFRVAVFNGAGGLLPQYQTLVPSADIGARVVSSGALMVHSGETVRPATVGRDGRESGGDTFVVNVTSPTQVLDPVDINRNLAFLRKTSGR